MAAQGGQDFMVQWYAAQAMEAFRKSEQDSSLGDAMTAYLMANKLRNAAPPGPKEADKIYCQILNIAKKHLGPRHPMTLLHMANMCGFYKQYNLEKLHPMMQTILEALREMRGTRSLPFVIVSLTEYGDVLKRTDATEAIAMYTEALQFARERLRENASDIQTLEQRIKDAKVKEKNSSSGHSQQQRPLEPGAAANDSW